MSLTRALLLGVAAGLLLSVPLLPQANPTTAQTISAQNGGEVASPSGKATLAIPAGALAADTQVSIGELEEEEGFAIGPVYELAPDGLQFSKPATLTIRYSAADVPEGHEAEDVVITQVLSAEPAALPPGGGAAVGGGAAPPQAGFDVLDTTVAAAGTASAQLQHLSRYRLRSVKGYRLGTNESLTRGVANFLDMTLAPHGVDGSGDANSACAVTGEFLMDAFVPNGELGIAFAQAIGVKLFRVKPGADGRRETTEAEVSVQMRHEGDIDAGTNSYQIGYTVQLRECGIEDFLASFRGEPKASGVEDADEFGPYRLGGGIVPGMEFRTGAFSRAFFQHPDIKTNQFPYGPRYEPEQPLVTFERCHLVAGHTYAVQVSAHATAIGNPYKRMGGRIEFPLGAFSINWIEVTTG